jgi:predicted kinase
MPKLTVLMGAPGSGKSTYASRLGTVVTQDRAIPQAAGEIVHESFQQINKLLGQGKDVVFDTTGANPNVRKAALSIARRHGAEASICVLDTPLQTCLDVQKSRTRAVPEATVRRMHADVRRQIPGLTKEGFKSVVVTRDRK